MSTLTAATGTADPGVRRWVHHVMGMPVSLALRGRHADTVAGRDAWAQVRATLEDVDRVFSTWRADTVISRLGRGEVALADCPPEVAEVLALGETACRESAGAFDVRRGGVLDPSGVVKGWAVDRAAAPLRLLEDTDHALSAGGDMVCHVADPDRPAWRVGVEDPLDPARVLAVVPVRRGAVATSGAAHRGAHVTDARSGRAPTRLASVTVIGPDLVWADVDATAAFAMDADAEAWLAGRAGRTALVVRADGTTATVVGRG